MEILNKVIESCKAIIDQYNQEHGFNYKVEASTLRKDYLMEAHVENGSIVYDPLQIRKFFKEPEFSKQTSITDIEELVHILIVHEIGHLLDFNENPSLYDGDDHLEQLEINAWRNGETLIPSELMNKYHAFRDISMESYRRDIFSENSSQK